MPSLLNRIIPFLAFLAVGYAQAFGMKQGFVCDHHAERVELREEHCHRDVENGEAPFIPCDGSGDGSKHSENNTGHHEPLTKEFQVTSVANTAVAVPVFLPMLLTELPSFELAAILTTPEAESGYNGSPPSDTGNVQLHYNVQMAKCMVLLV